MRKCSTRLDVPQVFAGLEAYASALLVGLGLARNLPLAAFCMMCLGSMSAIQFSTSNAYLQTSAPPHLRGRAVSMYVWIFQGMTPLGGFGAGWLASRAGIPVAILASGAACLLAGVALGATARKRVA